MNNLTWQMQPGNISRSSQHIHQRSMHLCVLLVVDVVAQGRVSVSSNVRVSAPERHPQTAMVQSLLPSVRKFLAAWCTLKVGASRVTHQCTTASPPGASQTKQDNTYNNLHQSKTTSGDHPGDLPRGGFPRTGRPPGARALHGDVPCRNARAA